jgi:hypothetical protein
MRPCSTLARTDSGSTTHNDSLGGGGGLNTGFLGTDDVCSNISVDSGTVLEADEGRGSCNSVLGGGYRVIDGHSALGTGGGIPSGGVSKGGGDLPVDGDDMCLFGGNNRGVSILVMGNGNLSVDIGDSLSAVGGAALGSGGGLDQICGGGNPPGARTISTCLLSSSPWRASMRRAPLGLPHRRHVYVHGWAYLPLCWVDQLDTSMLVDHEDATTTTSTVLGDD